MQISNKEYKRLKFCELCLALFAMEGLYNFTQVKDELEYLKKLDKVQYEKTIDYVIDNYEEILDDYKNRKTTESK